MKKSIKFNGTIINTPEYQCAIVKIPKSVIRNQKEAEDSYETFKPLFKFLPLVFMSTDQGIPHALYGEEEAVRFVSQYPHKLIVWGEFEKDI